TTRNGKQLGEVELERPPQKYGATEKDEGNDDVRGNEKAAEMERPPPPFPQRLKKHKEEACFKKFIEMLKQ
ncbi:hypothetical protein HAX54_034683, partial [Datura stramonium]|nr:hypothetical protein [Datura stramonium]